MFVRYAVLRVQSAISQHEIREKAKSNHQAHQRRRYKWPNESSVPGKRRGSGHGGAQSLNQSVALAISHHAPCFLPSRLFLCITQEVLLNTGMPWRRSDQRTSEAILPSTAVAIATRSMLRHHSLITRTARTRRGLLWMTWNHQCRLPWRKEEKSARRRLTCVRPRPQSELSGGRGSRRKFSRHFVSVVDVFFVFFVGMHA